MVRAGGRTRGLHSKAWTGLPTGATLSRRQPAGRETSDIPAHIINTVQWIDFSPEGALRKP